MYGHFKRWTSAHEKTWLRTVEVYGLVCELNYHDQKIWQTLTHNIRKHWTAVLTLLGLISSVYYDITDQNTSQYAPGIPPYRICIFSYDVLKVEYIIADFKAFFFTLNQRIYIFCFLSKGFILLIELPWPENPVNTYAWHTETLDSCFNLIWSYQQRIPRSPPLEIKPVTTECRAETQSLSHQFISNTSDAKPTSHSNCAAN